MLGSIISLWLSQLHRHLRLPEVSTSQTQCIFGRPPVAMPHQPAGFLPLMTPVL